MDSDNKDTPGFVSDEKLTKDLLEWKEWAEEWLEDVTNNNKKQENEKDNEE